MSEKCDELAQMLTFENEATRNNENIKCEDNLFIAVTIVAHVFDCDILASPKIGLSQEIDQ